MNTHTLHAAQDYAARGWHIFPQEPGTKKSHVAGRGGPRWGATTDADTIRGYWQQWPNAGLGVACQESGLVVVDLDQKPDADGLQWLADMEAQHGPLPDTVTAITPSGGQHLYFQYPDHFAPKTCESEIAPGVDVRGHGGMVIAPPTTRADKGAAYLWAKSPDTTPVAVMPSWLADILPRRHDAACRATAPLMPGTERPTDPAMMAEVEELLTHIDPDAGGYDGWQRALAAIHDASGGSNAGSVPTRGVGGRARSHLA